MNVYSNISFAIHAHASALLISLINQINHHLDHHILFFSLALSNHQGQCYEGVICQAFGAILAI